MMALKTSAISLSSSGMKFLKGQSRELQRHLLINVGRHPNYPALSVKLPTTAQFPEPSKNKLQMNCIRENLWDLIPSPIKEFPLEKARAKASQYARKALSWSIFVLNTLVSILDLIVSISRNKELSALALALGTFGLFVGWMMTVFLKKKSQEWFPNFGESAICLGLFMFFHLVKNISSEFTLGRQEYLLHFANGGLMQLFWVSKRMRSGNENDEDDDENNPMSDDVSPEKSFICWSEAQEIMSSNSSTGSEMLGLSRCY